MLFNWSYDLIVSSVVIYQVTLLQGIAEDYKSDTSDLLR